MPRAPLRSVPPLAPLLALAALLLTGCPRTPQAGGPKPPPPVPKPPAPVVARALETEAQGLIATQAKLYWRAWAFGNPARLSATYHGHRALFSKASIEVVARARSQAKDPARRLALRDLRDYLMGENLARALAPIHRQIAQVEASALLHVGGQDIPYRDLGRLLASETDPRSGASSTTPPGRWWPSWPRSSPRRRRSPRGWSRTWATRAPCPSPPSSARPTPTGSRSRRRTCWPGPGTSPGGPGAGGDPAPGLWPRQAHPRRRAPALPHRQPRHGVPGGEGGAADGGHLQGDGALGGRRGAHHGGHQGPAPEDRAPGVLPGGGARGRAGVGEGGRRRRRPGGAAPRDGPGRGLRPRPTAATPSPSSSSAEGGGARSRGRF